MNGEKGSSRFEKRNREANKVQRAVYSSEYYEVGKPVFALYLDISWFFCRTVLFDDPINFSYVETTERNV